MDWEINEVGKVPKLHDAILIEGLPGIGNVGKLAVDFLIEELKAKKIYEFFSYSMPHSVFVNEENLVDLPKIEMYYAMVKGQSILLLSGDTQPIDEVSSYVFSEKVLGIAERFSTKEVITIGGIGLSNVPASPKVFCTGNCKDIIRKYKKGTEMNDQIFGVVGPIIGVSGCLLGSQRGEYEGSLPAG
jgi:proteasome assembly chaperone (PAC2) family protein